MECRRAMDDGALRGWGAREGNGLQMAAVRMMSRAQWFLMSFPMMCGRENCRSREDSESSREEVTAG